ncbi:hypothetical protein F5B19DRAFT_472085 [Rostrohypoxylon terebratum]|nr:hypothetical protein F5B19DRAFT_472085 [Rostrohypoxylon terebratum]
MTKQWDMHEATIKQLYAENTLAVVRQIMIDRYGFKASVRAYRGRLIRWGVRKYNCRKRASSDGSGSVRDSSFPGSPDATPPSMMANTMATQVPYNTGGHLAMPQQINQQPLYNPMDDHRARMYNAQNSYDIKPKPILSPPQTHLSNGNGGNGNLGYAWESTLPPPKRLSGSSNSTSSSSYDHFSPANHHSGNSSSAEIMAPPTFFGGYGAPVPMTATATAAAAAMGHTNSHGNYSAEQMNRMDHSGNGNGNSHGSDSGGTNPFSMPNTEYHRHRGSDGGGGSIGGGYYDGTANRNAPACHQGSGDSGWA